MLSEQYDGLRIQMTEARAEAKTAMTTYRQDATRLVSGQAAIGQLAAESYMNGGLATPLQVLTSTDTSTMLSRAAIMQQLQTENGDRVSALSTAEAAARRAHDTAVQQMTKVTTAGQVHGGQEEDHPGQGEHAQQRGVRPGHDHLTSRPGTTPTSTCPRPTRSARRRCGTR